MVVELQKRFQGTCVLLAARRLLFAKRLFLLVLCSPLQPKLHIIHEDVLKVDLPFFDLRCQHSVPGTVSPSMLL